MRTFWKLLSFVLVIIFSFSLLYGQFTLTDLYQWDYELINRTVVVLSGRPVHTVEHSSDDRQVVLSMERTDKGPNVPSFRRFSSNVLDSISINEEQRGKLTLTIATKENFSLRYFHLEGDEHKIVFDIYNKRTPTTDLEKLVFARFYYHVNFTERAEKLLREVIKSAPGLTSANYYLGSILKNRRQNQQAIDFLKRVKPSDPEYLKAQGALLNLGVKETAVSHEIQSAFDKLQEYFLKAQDLSRMNYLLYMVSAAYGEQEIAKRHLQKISPQNSDVQKLRDNFGEVNTNLYSEASLSPLLPERQIMERAEPTKTKTGFPWIILLLAILITALLTYFLTLHFLDKRNENADFGLNIADEDVPVSESKVESHEADVSRQTEQEQPVGKEPEKEPEKTKPTAKKDKNNQPVKDKDSIQPERIPSEDLEKKLAQKLHKDGWETKAISAELRKPESEIESYINELDWE